MRKTHAWGVALNSCPRTTCKRTAEEETNEDGRPEVK
jgi:hypothetical protein